MGNTQSKASWLSLEENTGERGEWYSNTENDSGHRLHMKVSQTGQEAIQQNEMLELKNDFFLIVIPPGVVIYQ